jgi:hypothetical protein
MIGLAFDENFNNDVLRGLIRRDPTLDLVRIQDVGLRTLDDEVVLAWAAENDRVLVTHDVSTITNPRIRPRCPRPQNARRSRSSSLTLNRHGH